jgi:hypothetical protein
LVRGGPRVQSITDELVVLHLVVNLRRVSKYTIVSTFEKQLDWESMDEQAGDENRIRGLHKLGTSFLSSGSIYEHLDEARIQRRISYVLGVREGKCGIA